MIRMDLQLFAHKRELAVPETDVTVSRKDWE